MTPAEAIEILRTASGLAALSRTDHLKVMQAIGVLEEVLKNLEKKDG